MEERFLESAELAAALRVRGMDAIIIQTSKERDSVLITFDDQMAKRARGAAKDGKYESLISSLPSFHRNCGFSCCCFQA